MGAELGLGNLTGSSTATSQPTSNATASRAPAQTSQSSGGGGSIVKLLIPLLLLGALAYAAMQFMGGNDGGADEAMNEEVPALNIDGDVDMNAAPKAMDLDFGGIDFGAIGGEAGEKLKGLSGQFTGIADGFKGLTDETGANALVGQLEGLTGSVGDLGLGEMSGIAKTSASTMVGKFAELVQGFVENVENPTLKAIVQPAVQALVSKLTSLGL